jgi:Na+/melibiose symporter-like transporter
LREPGFVKAAKQEKTPFWKDMKRGATNKNFVKLTFTIFTLAMGFNFVQLLGSYIPIFYVFGGDKVAGARLLGINGTIWAITGVLAVFPLNWISPKLGKRNTLITAMLLMCLAQISKIICYNPGHPYLIIIPTVLLSAGMLFFFTLGSSMVGDICDEDELNTGHRSEGSYYAIFWWFIKMGSALASFVAGALIVFTMFDETQVTKVDGLQGSIREIRSKVQYWEGYHSLTSSGAEWLEKTKIQTAEALEEAKEYSNYLGKESLKKQEKKNLTLPAYPGRRRNMLLNQLSTTKAIINDLEQLHSRIENMGPRPPDSLIKTIVEKAIPLTLQTKLEKARKNSFELMSHLEDKSLKTKNSKGHYEEIMQNISGVNNRLTKMNSTLPLVFIDKDLVTIENEIVPLTKQTPYTLLMMRVVEIGLPLLLSLISIFFIVRFSLTEKRCHEIKELLRQRNLEHANGAETTK